MLKSQTDGGDGPKTCTHLAIEGGGVMTRPEEGEEGGVGAGGGVEVHADDLGVAGVGAADGPVGGIREVALRVPHLGLHHPFQALEGQFQPPEAPGCKLRQVEAGLYRRV